MERLVTTSQAAEILGLSLQGIHYRIKKEQLKSIKKDGKTFVYINDDMTTFQTTQKTKVEAPKISTDNTNAIIEVKNEQIELLKKSIKWMKKQYISEIFRLEKNQKRIIEVFNSEIKLLQSAFNEMRSIYRPQIDNKNSNNEANNNLMLIKDFFILMKRFNKTEAEIKNIIFTALKNGDKRFIYNKRDKKLLIIDSNFDDLI